MTPTIAEIQVEVARRLGLHPLAAGRPFARHVAIYILRRTTGQSYRQLGRTVDRGHDAVMYACRRVHELASADPDFGERVQSLLEHFRA